MLSRSSAASPDIAEAYQQLLWQLSGADLPAQHHSGPGKAANDSYESAHGSHDSLHVSHHVHGRQFRHFHQHAMQHGPDSVAASPPPPLDAPPFPHQQQDVPQSHSLGNIGEFLIDERLVPIMGSAGEQAFDRVTARGDFGPAWTILEAMRKV